VFEKTAAEASAIKQVSGKERQIAE